jgi:hypothetical protein
MAIKTPAADAPYKQWRDYAAAMNPDLKGSRLTDKTREYIQFARSAQDGINDVTGPVTSSPPGDARPGYFWVQNADGSWVEVAVDPGAVTNPVDPGDPTDPPSDPPGPPDLDAGTVNARKSAREYLDGLFKQFGFSDADRATLLGQVDGWITEGLADAGTDAVLMKFRGTDVYARRFAGMAELRQRGQAVSEAEYIQLESSYRNVMQNYGIKDTFYNSYDDFARLIGAGLSPKEVEERVVAAKQAMNPLVAAELKQYYNVTEGDLTAYMLGLTDGKGLLLESARTQEQIRTGARAAQIGAAAERAGFNMDKTFSERLGGTSVGQTIDPFQMGTLANLEGTFDQARRVADRETTLAAIDREAFDQRDALSAAFGDEQKKLASERRARRERARFSGSSGAAASSLGVERNL